MQPIIIPDVRISEAEYVALSTRLHQRQRWIAVGLTVAFAAYLVWSSGDFTDSKFLLIYSGVLVFMLALTWWWARKRFRKTYSSTPSLQQTVTYTLTADGIATNSLLGQSTIGWANIQSVRPLRPWFIVTTSPGVYIPLDGRLVQAPHTAADLGLALTQRGANLSSSTVPAATPVSSPVGPAISIPNVHPTLGQYTWLSLRLTARLMPLMWVLLLPICSTLLVAGQLLVGEKPLTELWQNNSGQLLMMLFFLSIPLFILWGIRKQYRNSPLLKHPANYLLTPDKMIVEYPGASAETGWAGVQKVHRIGRWAFLQTTTNIGYILDMTQVAAPNTDTDVMTLLQAQRVPVK